MQREMENVLNFLEFDFRDIIEMDYLINLLNKFSAIEEAKEGIFQFHPKYNEKGRSQKFSSFYKEIILDEIIFQILETIYINLKKDLNNNNNENFLLKSLTKKEKNILKNLNDEDFTETFYLNNKYHQKFSEFILKNDLKFFTKEEIVEKFQNKFIYDLNSFFN